MRRARNCQRNFIIVIVRRIHDCCALTTAGRARSCLNKPKLFSLRRYSLYLRASRGSMNYTTASCLTINNRTCRSRNNGNKVISRYTIVPQLSPCGAVVTDLPDSRQRRNKTALDPKVAGQSSRNNSTAISRETVSEP